MESLRVKDLREIAKSRGLRGWSRLRKSELISFIKDNEMTTSLLDKEIPRNLPTPTLKPTQYTSPKITRSTTRRTLTDWEKWLIEHVPEPPKKNMSEAKKRVLDAYEQKPLKPAQLKLVSTALEGNVQRWSISGEGYKIPDVFLNDIESDVKKVVDDVSGPKKVYTNLKCTLVKYNLKTGERIYTEFNGRSRTHTITTELGDTYAETKSKMLESLGKFSKEGSGWQLYSITGLDIVVAKFEPLSGSGYSKLPKFISNKKAVINMKNERCKEGKKTSECECKKCEESKMCFKWAVTRALNMTDDHPHPERITKELRDQSEKYDWSGITFPTKVKDIPIWENNNKKIINVFGYDEDSKKVYSVRLCDGHESIVLNDDETQDDKFVSLFLHDDNHYCVVRNLSRLVSSQLSNHGHKKHFCLSCMNGFSTNEILRTHQEVCLMQKTQTEVYPKPGDTTKFKNYERLHDVPFEVYADFECFVKPLETEEKDSFHSYTTPYQSHVPSGFCYVIKCMDENVFPTKTVIKTVSYEGEDMGKAFVDSLSEDLRPVYEILKTETPMTMTEDDCDRYEKENSCYACGVEFGTICGTDKETGEPILVEKCRDHCHITGKYRGAACDKCNLRMRVPMFVPVIFHNLEGYDSHLFVKSLGLTEGDIKCIPKTDERYISLSKKVIMEKKLVITNGGVKVKELGLEMRFLDSFKFTLKSLEKLTEALGEDQFGTLTSQMSVDSKSLGLLKRKGVFPYDYMTDFSKLGATSLPPKEAFYNQLYDKSIVDEDYAHTKNVWETFGCETMRDYHDLYLKTDVLLLADVMTEFRRVCKKVYGLDALHYYTSPGLAWDAMLKYTNVELDLISDPDMYHMIENGIRGGVSSIMKRYAEANHKHLENYDPKNPSVFVEYLDANNLYGWAMSKPLPYKNFYWMSEEKLSRWEENPCILEVDLEYPKDLHNFHNEYPLAPEGLLVDKVEKLIPNLDDKNKYVSHHKNLRLYLRLGLKLTKIHRGVSFDEKDFVKPYIDLNTSMRAKGTTDFEKDFYKLMNNAVFGKTMENVRKRVNVKLVTNKEALNKLVKKPTFDKLTEFHENLVAVHMKKTTVKLFKPIYLGMSILDLSKTLMYKFHYDYVKPKWGDKAELLFTDTDSLCYEIRTEDFHKDISEDLNEWFDTSNYEKDHPLRSDKNKKQIGFMKDECRGNHILEFVGLRPKSYSYEVDRLKDDDGVMCFDVQMKKCKGVKKYVVKDHITHEDYKECLFSAESQFRTMNTIRSRQHDVGSERINKTPLSAQDDKRIVLEDGIHTLAIGYKLP